MGTVLQFTMPRAGHAPKREADTTSDCRIVIFPGVRIERHDERSLDLGHRMRDSAGRDSFDGITGGDRPRKSS